MRSRATSTPSRDPAASGRHRPEHGPVKVALPHLEDVRRLCTPDARRLIQTLGDKPVQLIGVVKRSADHHVVGARGEADVAYLFHRAQTVRYLGERTRLHLDV